VVKFEADFAAFDIDDNDNVEVKDYVCANDDNDDIIMRAKGTKNEGGECEEEDVFLSSSSSGSSVDDILFDEHSLMFVCEEESSIMHVFLCPLLRCFSRHLSFLPFI